MLIDLAAHLSKSSAYYFDWVHFSNEGAAVVAELVAQELLPVIGQERRKAIP